MTARWRVVLKIRFLRERSESLLLKIELQNLPKSDFCERSELRLWKIEVENVKKVYFCERSELHLLKIEVQNLQKLDFLRAKRATFIAN